MKSRINQDKIISILSYTVVGAFSLICLYPLLLTLMVSLSDEYLVQVNGFSLIPQKFSLDTYKYVWKSSSQNIARAYGMTLLVTGLGTLFSMIVSSMMAYTLSQKHIKYRNALSFFSYFTVIFPAGMIPWYIVCVNVLHLKNSILALIIPYGVSVWNLFLLRNYFLSIPDSVGESAKIDGANDFVIYSKIVMPMSQTAILTVGMFYAIQYWNDWWLSVMLISDRKMYPMQYYLFNILSSVSALASGRMQDSGRIAIPSQTIRMAVTFITILPILFLFPLIQKYFIKGIMVGAVKG